VVKWATPANLVLKDIHDYIARDSRYYAQKVSQDIVDKSEKLKHFPEIGRIVPEIDDPNIRELFIYILLSYLRSTSKRRASSCTDS